MIDTWSWPWRAIAPSEMPPRPLRIAEEIAAQIAILRSQTVVPKDGPPPEARLTASDGHGGIAILGDRGSGKSTVLHAACGLLEEQGLDLVLPVVYPELFRETDSVLGTFLASLWDRVQAADALLGDDPSDDGSLDDDSLMQLQRLILDASHIHAMARTSARALDNSSAGAEYADEAVAITQSSNRLVTILAEVTRAVSERSGNGLVILPIDDADLSRLGVRDVLRDLRLIGVVPGLIAIVCAKEEDLRGSWLREQGDGESSPLAIRSFRRFMEKLFPYRFRFEIEPLVPADRVAFTPIGTRRSVSELAEQFDTALAELGCGEAAMASLVSPESNYELPTPLPENPRALVQIWDTLDSAVGRGSREALALAMRQVIQVIGEPLEDAADAAGTKRFVTLVPSAQGADVLYRAEYEIEGWSLFISADGGFDTADDGSLAVVGPASSSVEARIRLRKVGTVQTSVRQKPTSDGRRQDDPQRLRMTATETASILAIEEMVARSDLFESNLETPLYFGNDEYAWLQEVEIAGLKTNNCFVMLPDTATHSGTRIGMDAWNSLVDRVHEDHPDVERLLCLSLVAAHAMLRRERPDYAQPLPSYAELFATTTDLFTAILDRGDGRRTEEEKRFVEWYFQAPPLHWHSSLLPDPTIGEALRIWKAAIAQARPGDSRIPAMRVLRVRSGEILDAAESAAGGVTDEHVWIAGYAIPVADFLPDLHARMLALYPDWAARGAILRAGSTSSIGSVSVGGSDSVVFSPYATQTGTELFGRAKSLLLNLRNSAMPRQSR